MKVLGIIVEYNPFHNGHIHHIQEAKKLIQPDYTIAVMSSSFVQRGEPAIINKWKRSQIAIEYGVDLVIELPFVYSCQSADYFAAGALKLLNAIGITDLCFGSEDGKIDTFIDIANAINDHQEDYQALTKQYMKQGMRYPYACNQALFHIMHKEITTPNDLLGLSYVKDIVNHHYPITPHCIARTNHYHGTDLKTIASATAIRQALKQKQDVSQSLPMSEVYQSHLYHLDDFFPYLQYILLTTKPQTLKTYHLVEEGLENVLIKNITEASSMQDFIASLLSKRYTRPRIQRMLIHILMQNTKEDIQEAMSIDYIRILAMNNHGRAYLKSIKKTCPYHIMTQFSSYRHPALNIEFKATKLLSLLDHSLIKQEYQNHAYIKKENSD